MFMYAVKKPAVAAAAALGEDGTAVFCDGLHEDDRPVPLGAGIVDAQIQLGPLDLRLPRDIEE